MNRPQRVRAVYAELRQAAPGSIPSGTLLEYANQLVDAFYEEEEPRFELHTGRPSIDHLAIDAVLADGGWRVLDRHSARGLDGDDDAVNDPLIRRQLENLGLEMCA